MKKIILVLLLLAIFSIVGCSSTKVYTPLQAGNIDLKVRWMDTDKHCEDHNQRIGMIIYVSYPLDVPLESQKVNCKYSIDNEMTETYYDIIEGEQYHLSFVDPRESYIVKACCFGDWETDRAFDACVEKEIEAWC